MTVQRVALIFDDAARPETTGVYCRQALKQLVKVTHFRRADLPRLPRQGFDLYLRIDDGLDWGLPDDARPVAWWAIDTHLSFDRCLIQARRADLAFAAQRDGAEEFRRAGVASATWLPLACDPAVHARHEVDKRFDVCFVGNVFPGPRAELLERLRRHFPNTFIGHSYFEEMARTFSAARTVFNRSIRNDVNMRVFEAMACGSLLLTNDLRDNGQAELFRDGVHLATYTGAEELLDKVAFYLSRPEVRSRVEAAGMQETHAHHTYRLRMEQILREAEKLSPHVPVTDPQGVAGPTAAGGVWPVEKSAGPLPDPAYYAFSRPELLARIPHSARQVLDVGCGTGRLGKALKERQAVRVTGLELDPRAAEAARHHLDEVLIGDVECQPTSFAEGTFDCVVCGDVLEHLRDPLAFLRRLLGWLQIDGHLVVSLPNVRHHSVVRSLLDGHWTYEAAGLLDRTHLCFFTRREVEKLIFRAGFSLQELTPLPGPGHADWVAQGRSREIRMAGLHLNLPSAEEAEELFVYQYRVTARPLPRQNFGLTSIVILTHNELAFTRECVGSIRTFTDEAYELIFVDNASTDGTADYLEALAAWDPRVRVVRNAVNRGFPAGANQGIRAAQGRQILLLNNDTVVTTGWLTRLLRTLHGDPTVGLTGPCSNRVSGEQQIPASYDSDLTGLDGFGWDWGKAHDRVAEDTDRLVGFCLLIRREVMERIGHLDERFGLGCFEDDDYCRRARRAGYRAVIARDAFVHHYGGSTFLGSGVDYAKLLRTNETLYLEKWSEVGGAPSAVPITGEVRLPAQEQSGSLSGLKIVQSAGDGLRLERTEVELSLCMIVRDNARTIRECLESIKPWVDEMVVVDTGSLDATPQIAAQLGARVFHFPWCDDFSAARNESVRHACGRWIFWMDSDDTINADNGRRLRELIRRPGNSAVVGYVMQVHCPGPGEDGQTDVTAVDHVKLFPNRLQLRFEGRLHEQIAPAIRRLRGEILKTDLFVTHSGYDHSPKGQQQKLERDLRLLHLELNERPEHTFTLYNLGMTYANIGQHSRAIDFLQDSVKQSGPDESHLRKVYALLTYCHAQLGQLPEAWSACREGLTKYPKDTELRFRRGVLLHTCGQLAEAVAAYRDLLEDPDEEDHFSSIDRGLRGFKTRQNLAVVYGDLGDWTRAEEQWRLVVREEPFYRTGWQGLGEVLSRQGKRKEALALADKLLADRRLRREGSILRSQLALANGDVPTARQYLQQAIGDFSEDMEVRQAWCQFLFERGDPAEAIQAVTDLLRLAPQDGAAHHNLGALYTRLGRWEEAVAAYQQSLVCRPQSALTSVQLARALGNIGREAEACRTWELVLQLEPGNPEARAALDRLRPIKHSSDYPSPAISSAVSVHSQQTTAEPGEWAITPGGPSQNK